jgi:predicted RNA-binding protein with PIN domain
VAREGLNEVPPVVPPPGIRRYLGFTKLSTAVVRAIARVLDRDDEYRSRVAAAVNEDAVGRAGWLWLTRPEGWQDEFAALEADAEASAATASEEREERDARRRLAAARAAAERATAIATAREQEAAGIRADLVDEQARRRLLEKHVARLEDELTQVRDERVTAVRQLKQVEANLARRTAEAKEATARLNELEGRPAQPAPGDDPPPAAMLDPAALAKALDAAAAGATGLATALRDLEQLARAAQDARPSTNPEPRLDRPDRPLTDPTDPTDPVDPTGASRSTDTLAAGTSTSTTPVGPRIALTLPGGIRDDSSEAVDCLLRTPGAWLLVDGYNVSMVGWPDCSVAEQRRRLASALSETAARTGATVTVIFDGAAIDPMPIPQSTRRLVSVQFSPVGVEADDVLLDLVRELPPARPVVVASSDNRVREGARRLGANLVHARQLVAVLRR